MVRGECQIKLVREQGLGGTVGGTVGDTVGGTVGGTLGGTKAARAQASRFRVFWGCF